MFIEEDFEQHVVNLLTSAKTATPQLEIKTIALMDDVDITLDNFHEYAKDQPAVIVGLLDDAILNTVGALNDSQNLTYELRVFLLVQSKEKKGGIMKAARPILRQLKNILRGLRYTSAEGATEGLGRLIYGGREFIAAQNGVALFLQTYALHTLDTNDTRRTI